MYGWINDCIEKLVVEKFGIEKWHAIKEKAGVDVPDGCWVRLQVYDDGCTVDLVMAAADILGVGSDVVLELFGQYFIHFVKGEGYSNLMFCQGDNLKSWLNNINDLHLHLENTLPEIVAPEFWCVDDPTTLGAVILRYRSKRGSLLAPLVVGLVKEVAVMYFNVNVDFTLLHLQDDELENKFTEWRITVSAEQSEDFDGDFHFALIQSNVDRYKRRSTKQTRGCPFHAMMVNILTQTYMHTYMFTYLFSCSI